MSKVSVDGRDIFNRLKRMQQALRIFSAATTVGIIAMAFALREAFDSLGPSFVFFVALFAVCALIALGAVFYLLRSRCPNCNAEFSWRWTHSDILKVDHAGRCSDYGIRINVP